MKETTTVLHRLGAIGDSPGDSETERLKHRFLVYMGVLMSMGGLMWGGLSLAVGLPVQSSIPFAYTLLTCLNFVYFSRSKAFGRVRFIQVLLSLMLPFMLQWSLGGFQVSGAVMLWSMLALVGSLTFSESKSTVLWLVVYLGLTVVSGVLDAPSRGWEIAASQGLRTTFFVLNITFISAVVFGLMLYMLIQREKAIRQQHELAQRNEKLEDEITKARRMGSYHLVEKLGEGGMGEVWRAEHSMLARPAAVKLIRPKMLGQNTDRADVMLARFEREAQATASLRSPHTVNLYDFGRTSDSAFYYVMELLDGVNLEDLVQRFGAQPPERVAFILAQVCDSLSEAHTTGLIHRDIKPANIFLGWYGTRFDHASVLDFGLVKAYTEDMEATKLTGDGVMAGTPAYAPPEAHITPDKLTDAADLYSLGCVAYWLVTGQMVFEANTAMQMVAQHLQTQPTPPSTLSEVPIPSELEQIILKCLSKNPEDRPSSAEELRERFKSLADGWSVERARGWWDLHFPDRDTGRTVHTHPRSWRAAFVADTGVLLDTVEHTPSPDATEPARPALILAGAAPAAPE